MGSGKPAGGLYGVGGAVSGTAGPATVAECNGLFCSPEKITAQAS